MGPMRAPGLAESALRLRARAAMTSSTPRISSLSSRLRPSAMIRGRRSLRRRRRAGFFPPRPGRASRTRKKSDGWRAALPFERARPLLERPLRVAAGLASGDAEGRRERKFSFGKRGRGSFGRGMRGRCGRFNRGRRRRAGSCFSGSDVVPACEAGAGGDTRSVLTATGATRPGSGRVADSYWGA